MALNAALDEELARLREVGGTGGAGADAALLEQLLKNPAAAAAAGGAALPPGLDMQDALSSEEKRALQSSLEGALGDENLMSDFQNWLKEMQQGGEGGGIPMEGMEEMSQMMKDPMMKEMMSQMEKMFDGGASAQSPPPAGGKSAKPVPPPKVQKEDRKLKEMKDDDILAAVDASILGGNTPQAAAGMKIKNAPDSTSSSSSSSGAKSKSKCTDSKRDAAQSPKSKSTPAKQEVLEKKDDGHDPNMGLSKEEVEKDAKASEKLMQQVQRTSEILSMNQPHMPQNAGPQQDPEGEGYEGVDGTLYQGMVAELKKYHKMVADDPSLGETFDLMLQEMFGKNVLEAAILSVITHLEPWLRENKARLLTDLGQEKGAAEIKRYKKMLGIYREVACIYAGGPNAQVGKRKRPGFSAEETSDSDEQDDEIEHKVSARDIDDDDEERGSDAKVDVASGKISPSDPPRGRTSISSSRSGVVEDSSSVSASSDIDAASSKDPPVKSTRTSPERKKTTAKARSPQTTSSRKLDKDGMPKDLTADETKRVDALMASLQELGELPQEVMDRIHAAGAKAGKAKEQKEAAASDKAFNEAKAKRNEDLAAMSGPIDLPSSKKAAKNGTTVSGGAKKAETGTAASSSPSSVGDEMNGPRPRKLSSHDLTHAADEARGIASAPRTKFGFDKTSINSYTNVSSADKGSDSAARPSSNDHDDEFRLFAEALKHIPGAGGMINPADMSKMADLFGKMDQVEDPLAGAAGGGAAAGSAGSTASPAQQKEFEKALMDTMAETFKNMQLNGMKKSGESGGDAVDDGGAVAQHLESMWKEFAKEFKNDSDPNMVSFEEALFGKDGVMGEVDAEKRKRTSGGSSSKTAGAVEKPKNSLATASNAGIKVPSAPSAAAAQTGGKIGSEATSTTNSARPASSSAKRHDQEKQKVDQASTAVPFAPPTREKEGAIDATGSQAEETDQSLLEQLPEEWKAKPNDPDAMDVDEADEKEPDCKMQ